MHIEIIPDASYPARLFTHNGTTYAEVPPAGMYSVRLTNTSAYRRLAVVSVDGINVISGEDAGYEGRGYVLGPNESTTIPGWLRGPTECARFTIAEAGASYAAQTGRGTVNTGIVGVAVFDEKPAPRPPWPNSFGTVPPWGGSVYRGLRSGDTLCSTIGTNVTRGVGTAYGQAGRFHTQSVAFERATQSPTAVLTVRYGTREQLRAWGVPVDGPPHVTASPTAFPATPGYAAPPAGWRG